MAIHGPSCIRWRGAIIPAAVGVDIGCGMMAVETTLRSANDLPDSLAKLRSEIERNVPARRWPNGNHDDRTPSAVALAYRDSTSNRYLDRIRDKHPKAFGSPQTGAQLGTLGGGNHFIEVCLDEAWPGSG
jgi:tRNA-splicing ligase RtcB